VRLCLSTVLSRPPCQRAWRPLRSNCWNGSTRYRGLDWLSRTGICGFALLRARTTRGITRSDRCGISTCWLIFVRPYPERPKTHDEFRGLGATGRYRVVACPARLLDWRQVGVWNCWRNNWFHCGRNLDALGQSQVLRVSPATRKCCSFCCPNCWLGVA